MYRAVEVDGRICLSEVGEEEVEDTILVFEGDCTCCARNHRGMKQCDKETLRDVFVGLYADVLFSCMPGSRPRQSTRDSVVSYCMNARIASKTEKVMSRIEEQKARIFPRTFTTTFESIRTTFQHDVGTVTQPLFGELIATVEAMLGDEALDVDELFGGRSAHRLVPASTETDVVAVEL